MVFGTRISPLPFNWLRSVAWQAQENGAAGGAGAPPWRAKRERRPRQELGQGPVGSAMLVAGATLAALSFNLLLRPAGVPSGGVVGVSLIGERLAHWSPAGMQWTLNLGLLLVCGNRLGRGFVLKSLAGAILVPLVVLLTAGLAPLTTHPGLAAVGGGAGLGAGLGLVYRANGSVGGFSAVALWCHRRLGWSIDRTMIGLDGLVLAVAALWLGPEPALYAGICVFVTGRTARAVMTGFNNAKVATIISPRADVIREAVLRDIPLGVTTLTGRGGFSGREQDVLMVVMTPAELVRLKAVVRALDPQAFMIVSDAAEVIGHGFSPHA